MLPQILPTPGNDINRTLLPKSVWVRSGSAFECNLLVVSAVSGLVLLWRWLQVSTIMDRATTALLCRSGIYQPQKATTSRCFPTAVSLVLQCWPSTGGTVVLSGAQHSSPLDYFNPHQGTVGHHLTLLQS